MSTEQENNVLNLIGRSWTSRIGEEFQKPYMDRIKEELLSQPFFPAIHNIFRALLSCSFEESKVVMLTTDLTTSKNVGLPFSTMDTMDTLGVVHKEFYNGLEDDLQFGDFLVNMPNLGYLPDRGVLLLNNSLTVGPDDQSKLDHLEAWRPFIKAVIQSFKEKGDKPVCFILMGEHAHDYEEEIDDIEHQVISVEHPVDAVGEDRPWKHENAFTKARDFLMEYYPNPDKKYL